MTTRPRRVTDPVEAVVGDALAAAGVLFVHESEQTAGIPALDFYLPAFNVHVECKRFHSERLTSQMSRAPDVIAIQGMGAAEAFARLLRRGVSTDPPEKLP